VRAHRASTSRRILVPRTVNPVYLSVAQTIAGNQNVVLQPVDFDRAQGRMLVDALRPYEGEDYAAVVVQQPNYFGVLEEVDALVDWAHDNDMLVIAVVNPLSLAVLKPPAEWGSPAAAKRGADVVCGEGQPLGVPLSSGGPYFGFMTTRMQYVRQMPGRIVGRTVDVDGREGFTLTLQAREQHIRRSKANSNICTNQGLTVTAATIYLSLLGADGLARVAEASMARTRELVVALTAVRGVRALFTGENFHEAVLGFDRPVAPLLAALAQRGIQGGLDLSERFPELGHSLLVCATETKTAEDIARYARVLEELQTPAALTRGAA
jgi:glycine dehydrogenase subunit 1